ncbi:magnesium transporter [Pelagovum pacificum]|uniref:Magnesium transporter MgtE n=1 Tax=Pelagovum pacificum TaxID=2588711 RepID=A0A5C5GCK2_9RHOB|nr:magnesium transporter [Pelagovum pacificum]QQA44358.1 magnesium transporter [Pelagovum pacificum]TNY32525.1 magnesium transporter [Pelagovum pacificum]
MAEDVIEIGEDAYALKSELFQKVRDAIEAGNGEDIDMLMEPLHAADIADFLEQIEPHERRDLLEIWKGGLDGEILSEIEDNVREEILGYLTPQELTEAVRELESDDVVDLVEYLDEDQQEAVLELLGPMDRVAVEKALAYPEESAGRLMQVETVRAPQHWTVGEMIDFLRAHPDELPDQFYHVILVDPRMKPVGNVTLGRLMSSRRDVKLFDIKEEMFTTIPAEQDEGEVAYAFNQYHLISAPVVDEDGRLVGVITIDDAMIVLAEENAEDLLRLAGVGENTVNDRVVTTTRQRFPWLAVNLVTAILASLVISLFEDVIAGLVALAVLMPIVASMGGNAGTQSLTVAVRAIATKDLTGSNVLRVIRREVLVGLINGLIFAVVMGIIGILWFGEPLLGVVIAAAMVINLVIAGLAGTVIPVVLEKLGIDPALASGAFVTTVTDVVGFFAFLGLAAVVLL